MSSANWYFAADDRQHGPFPFVELIARVRTGLIGPETLVWTESLKHWTPAKAITDLEHHFADAPTVPLQSTATISQPEEPIPAFLDPSTQQQPAHKTVTDVPQIRPWVRYFARITDITILSCAALSALTLISGELSTLQQISLNFLIGLSWAILESLLLIAVGTTPGKWLFGITLVSKNGGDLTPTQAFNRSVMVWIFGTGLFLPILSLVTTIFSYINLNSLGTTRWDLANDTRIIHEEIGWQRIVMITMLYVGLVVVVFVSAAVGILIQA
jgi:uncharacterized RDD family membrane protein YckC